MKLTFNCLLAGLFMVLLSQSVSATLISDAGTASASQDTVCYSVATSLMLTGYTGNIQWQSFDGSIWIDETGPGSTTDNYIVTLTVTTDFRAVVTDPGFPPDTSNVVTITVGVNAPVTTGDSRCGYGPVTLNATGTGAGIRWYDAPTGGTMLGNGNSLNTTVAATTTFYAAETSSGGSSGTPAIPPHSTVYNGYTRGYWFAAPVDFNITSLYVPTDASLDNQSIAVLSYPPGTPPPDGNAIFGFSTLYLTQNNPATGAISVNIPVLAGEYILILGNRGSDATNNFGAINSYTNTTVFTTTIDGINVDLNRGGMQSNLTGFDPAVVGALIVSGGTGSKGRIEFSYEIGCESTRTPAIATVTTAPSISISAVPPALCEGQSSSITVNSSSPNYSYTWSPATGLSGTTGATVTATPLSPITYTVIADDGTCGAIDSVFISVGPASVAGTAAISSDTICTGTPAFLTVTGYTGNIQWQSFDGVNWVNETGPGSTTDNYEISPATATIYQAVVTSGGCDPDTTITLSLDVLNITDPTTVNDTICSPGVATLSATGTGVMQWFDVPTGGVSVFTGNPYNPNVITTTTYYVQASAGGQFNVGPPDLSFGSQVSNSNSYGLQFVVTQSVTINRVSVSPGIVSGNINVNLRDAGGVIINTATIPVQAFSGLTPVNLGFNVNPGTYSLELATGSVALYHNTTNAVYPYTSPGNPVSITGYLNPNPGTGGQYYFFYNWEVSVGCASNRIPATAFVNPAPPVPVVSQNGTILTSSAPSNNQWYMNGNPIIGATGTTFDLTNTGSGTYTVTVTIDGCSSTSFPVVYTGIREDLAAAGISVYPNPVKDVLSVVFDRMQGNPVLNIYNSLGELVISRQVQNLKTDIDFDFPAGVYILEIKDGTSIYHSSIIKN